MALPALVLAHGPVVAGRSVAAGHMIHGKHLIFVAGVYSFRSSIRNTDISFKIFLV